MRTNREIAEELKETSPELAGMDLPNPYQVPEGYFESLPAQLMQLLGAGASLPVTGVADYRVPEGYFDSLAGNILSKIKTGTAATETGAELEQVAPALHAMTRRNVYTVPQGYFDSVPTIPAAKPAKLVKMKFARKWTQYAVAAVLAGVLVTGAFLYTGNKDASGPEYPATDMASELNGISDSDLASYVSNTGVNNEPGTDVKKDISDMSDDELNHYLSENDDLETIQVLN